MCAVSGLQDFKEHLNLLNDSLQGFKGHANCFDDSLSVSLQGFKGHVSLLDDSLQGFKDCTLLLLIVARVLRMLLRFG